MRLVTFKIDEDLLDELDRLAAKTWKTRSQIIREAIKEYIRNYHKVRYGTIRYRKVVLV